MPVQFFKPSGLYCLSRVHRVAQQIVKLFSKWRIEGEVLVRASVTSLKLYLVYTVVKYLCECVARFILLEVLRWTDCAK